MVQNNSPRNALSADAVSRMMAASLPKDISPQINTVYDAVALACHSGMLSVGFRLVGLGEDHRIEATSTPDQPQPLPQEWNSSAPNYAFRYKHGQSSMEYLLKVSRMGNRAMVMGMATEGDKTATFDLRVVDYISEGSLPSTPVKEGTSDQEAAKTLQDIFISVGRLSDLGSLLRLNIIQKLAPGIHKEGYEAPREQSSTPTGAGQRGPSANRGEPEQPQHDPLRDDPTTSSYSRRVQSPGFEDPYDLNRPLGGIGGIGGIGGGLPRIGDRDLYPQGLGPNDPFGNMGGFGPGGGGMHPTPDDLFPTQGGGRGFHPHAPPGARYDDPFGPGGPGGGAPRGTGLGGRPPNPFGGFGGGDFI
ncbi:hypothetical protein H2203_000788 [Taxawa tesnikishii (nom. ined.)]|nr:hypothetical protein H2203_000788 [Dothideales sp. JES 119]